MGGNNNYPRYNPQGTPRGNPQGNLRGNVPLNNTPGPYNTQEHYQNSNKIIWILVMAFAIVALIVFLVIFFVLFSSKTISEDDFSGGTTFNLKENKKIKFTLEGETHTLEVDSVRTDSVDLIIRSDPINVNLMIDEEEKFDLDNDDFFDIQIKLNDITNGVPRLYLKKIHENICTESWGCGNWSDCTLSESQSRTCVDSNSCGTFESKPTLSQACIYIEPCIENWNCTNWNTCFNSTQNRSCTDLNSCGNLSGMPGINQSCTEILCLEFNNITSNSAGTCCDDNSLNKSLDSQTGITSGYGCCNNNTCHEHTNFSDGDSSASGYMCVANGLFLNARTYNLDIDYFVVCYNGAWWNMNVTDCTWCNTSIPPLILNTSDEEFESLLLDRT